MRYAMAALVAIVVVLLWRSGQDASGPAQDAIALLSTLAVAILVGGIALFNILTVRAARAEHRELEAIEELLQLRYWPQAATRVQAFLSRPARSPATRAQALLFLGMLLARYHRFEDSAVVHAYLLEEVPLDDAAAHAVRLGRAMALLREDSLLDADRAIAELRRESRGSQSPGLALVEIYRDVKTGHPAEAIEMFEKSLAMMRRHLGHRIADAWALAARAYDLLGRAAEATVAYQNATLLAPIAELQRRYPEIAALAPRFSPTQTPAELM
jgi:tetratricopeptide (TPR) repeat protein